MRFIFLKEWETGAQVMVNVDQIFMIERHEDVIDDKGQEGSTIHFAKDHTLVVYDTLEKIMDKIGDRYVELEK